MEGLSSFYDSLELDIYGCNPGGEIIHVSEVWNTQNDFEVRHVELHVTKLDAWLEGRCEANATGIDSYPIVRLVRLPWLEAPSTHPHIAKSSLDLILERFCLQSTYKYMFTSLEGSAFFPRGKKEDGYSFAIFLSSFQLAWRYNTTTGRTEALCRVSKQADGILKALLSHQKAFAPHPMFLALIGSITISQVAEEAESIHSTVICKVEARTRNRGWEFDDPIEGSYSFLSEKMSGCETFLAHIKRSTVLLRETFRSMRVFLHQQHIEGNPEFEVANRDIKECIEFLTGRLATLEASIDFQSKRAQIQITAVSQLTCLSAVHQLNKPCTNILIELSSSFSTSFPNKATESA